MPQDVSPTISKIAANAGVSAGTVSRMLNNKIKGDRPAIARRIERVRQIARDMGYKPNTAARSIVTGRFGSAAFMTCRDVGSNWIPRSLLHGVADELEKVNTRLVFSEVPASKLTEADFVPSLLQEASVDALLVFPNIAFSERVFNTFEAGGNPLVWMNLKIPTRAVYPDDRQGMEVAIDHLIRRGHKNIGYVGRRIVQGAAHYSELEREQAFHELLDARGLASTRVQIAYHEDRPHTTIGMAAHFLESHPDSTAAVCYGLEESVALYAALRDAGRQVPKDFEILAFSDQHIPSLISLPVQTLIVPFEEVGRRAVRLMSRMLENKGERDLPSEAVPFLDVLVE